VQLNWDRTKYLLGFNTAIIGVGTGLIKIGSHSAATPLLIGIFVVGLVAATLSIFAVYLQHTYYRSTRDRMVALASQLNSKTPASQQPLVSATNVLTSCRGSAGSRIFCTLFCLLSHSSTFLELCT